MSDAPLLQGDERARFLARLERFDLGLRKIGAGVGSGEATARERGIGTEFRDHRAYAPGDDPRRLDWNIFLRHQELRVRTYEAERSPRLLLFVDDQASWRTPTAAKALALRRLVLAVAWVALRRGAEVELAHTTGDPTRRFIGRGGRALGGLDQALSELAPLRSTGGDVGAAAAIRRYGEGRPVRRHALFFGDHYDLPSTRAALKAFASFRMPTVLVRVLCAEEREPQAGGRVALVDAATGRTRTLRLRKRLIRSYREALAEHDAALAELLRECGVLWSDIAAESAPEEALPEILRALGGVGRGRG